MAGVFWWRGRGRWRPPAPRWWNSLPLRLALVLNLTALAVLGGFWVLDYRRARSSYLKVETGRLTEEARVLRAARAQLGNGGRFQRFLDTFCRQMGIVASPGHHIVVFDPLGGVAARAHERADARLELEMRRARGPSGAFRYRGQTYLCVQVMAADQARVVIAQSLAPIQAIIHAQAVSRAASLGLLALLVFGVSTVVLLWWVRDPLRALVRGVRELGRRRFEVRVRPAGTAELRYLAEGFNDMARALELVEKQRAAQMQRARAIQTGLLPPQGGRHPGYQIAAVFHPADSVGGDLYDVVETPDGSTLLAVLDVSGHGVAAALYTALLRTVLRHAARATADPAGIVAAMNREFAGVAGDSGEFATCFLARLERSSGALEYVGAGHDPAVLLRADGAEELLASGGPPIGLEPASAYQASRAELRPGDRLYLYTDGVHEVFDQQGAKFGRGHLLELLAATSRCPPGEQLGRVMRTIRAYAGDGGLKDDLTLLCALRRADRCDAAAAGDASPGRVRSRRGPDRRGAARA